MAHGNGTEKSPGEATRSVPKELPTVEEVLARYASVMQPVNPSSKSWSSSRLCLGNDGTIISVLQVLAKEKYGEHYDPELHLAYWADKDWTHETWGNVRIATRNRGNIRRGNPYGAPSGTKEYWKAYREKNAERVKGYHDKAQKRYRGKLAAAMQRIAELEGQEPENVVARLLGRTEAEDHGND